MYPSIVVGVTIGATVFTMLPPVIIAFLLLIVIPILFFMSLKKLLTIIKNEREKFGPICGKKDEDLADQAEPDLKADMQNDAQKTTVAVKSEGNTEVPESCNVTKHSDEE